MGGAGNKGDVIVGGASEGRRCHRGRGLCGPPPPVTSLPVPRPLRVKLFPPIPRVKEPGRRGEEAEVVRGRGLGRGGGAWGDGRVGVAFFPVTPPPFPAGSVGGGCRSRGPGSDARDGRMRPCPPHCPSLTGAIKPWGLLGKIKKKKRSLSCVVCQSRAWGRGGRTIKKFFFFFFLQEQRWPPRGP